MSARATIRPFEGEEQIWIHLRPVLHLSILLASQLPTTTYGDLEVHHLVRERRHFIVEAESVLARVLRSEDEITLSFFLSFHYFLVIWSIYRVIDIERAAGLDLKMSEQAELRAGQTYSKIKGDFGVLSFDGSEEAGFLVGPESVCQSCSVDTGDGQSQQAEEY